MRNKFISAEEALNFFRVQNSQLHASYRGPLALLAINRPYRDFTLRGEVMVNKGGNSGIYFRHNDSANVQSSEFNFSDDATFPSQDARGCMVVSMAKLPQKCAQNSSSALGTDLNSTCKVKRLTLPLTARSDQHQLADAFLWICCGAGK